MNRRLASELPAELGSNIRSVAYPRRLIEVDLPIRRISEHARRDKQVRHGHISTLHIWWARRPLAACRAIVCAALWPDPADDKCPESFRLCAREAMKAWAVNHLKLLSAESLNRFVQIQKQPNLLDDHREVRMALLDFIADFADWDHANLDPYIKTARALTQAAHESLGGIPGTKPLVIDPFAGGGAIPLESARVGAEAFASDLNPIAVLLNKFILEYVPRYGHRFGIEIKKWGDWVKKEAEKELAEFYQADQEGGVPIAFLWARAIISEAPSENRMPVEVPLLRSMWLSKRKGFLRALRWERTSTGEIATERVIVKRNGEELTVLRPLLEIFAPKDINEVPPATAKGGAATCPITGFTTPATRVKEQLKTQRGGANFARLYAVYVERSSGREFRLATKSDYSTYQRAADLAGSLLAKDPDCFPTEQINPTRPYANTRGLSAVTRIGCLCFADVYNARQALSIHSFYRVLGRLHSADLGIDKLFADAVETALAFAVNRAVSQNTSISRWDASRLTIKGAFSKQALAVVWDFAEANPFSGATADWDGAISWITEFVDANASDQVAGAAVRSSATDIPLPSNAATALITDPPYFSAIPYSDLSDFFYVWMRRGLLAIHPDLFSSSLTVKTDELIVTNAQKGPGDRAKNHAFFREGMTAALSRARDVVQTSGIGIVVYAEGTTAGWEAILNAIVDSGWTVTSSWPLDTEMENRTQAQGSASLQSSIHIVCRPRHFTENVGDWRDVLQELPARIHQWMPRLANEGVVGADAIFACLGPALEIFSRYSHVEKANGERITLGEYLVYVWAAVAKEALTLVFEGADASGFEEDARLTAMWLWTLSTGEDGNALDDQEEEPDDEEDESAGRGS